MKKLPLLFALLTIPFGVSSVSALTIDFEGLTGSANTAGGYVDAGDFRFTITNAVNASIEIITAQADIVEANTTKLFVANHTEIAMTRIDGGAFSLVGFDIGGSFISSPNRWADRVEASDGSNTISTTLTGLGASYTYVATPLFTNTTSVSFTPFQNLSGGINDYEFTLDNIEVGSASVPDSGTTLALLGLALTGLAVVRRRFA